MAKKISIEEYNERIRTFCPNLHLLEEFKIDKDYYYKTHCDTCNTTFDINKKLIKNAIHKHNVNKIRDNYCPVCLNKIIIKGVNDISTTAKWMMDYIKNPNDAYTHSKSSNKRIIFKCPICGDEKESCINNVNYFGFSCNKCSDNVSRPNKFIRSLFKQLPVYFFKPEYKTDWTENYIYDMYFELKENNIIKKYAIEMDGVQHYKEMWGEFDDIKYRDERKNILAKENNVTLIRINCYKSDPKSIKKKICSSLLNELFDLDLIDWNQIFNDCKNNYMIDICKYKNEHKELSCEEIAKYFNLSRQTIHHYLKEGYSLGLCSDSDIYHITNNKIYFNYETPILVFDLKGNFIKEYSSLNECCSQINKIYPDIKISKNDIKDVLKCYRLSSGGLFFKFKNIDVGEIYKDKMDNKTMLMLYDYYNNNNTSYAKMEKIFNISEHMINRYINICKLCLKQ